MTTRIIGPISVSRCPLPPSAARMTRLQPRPKYPGGMNNIIKSEMMRTISWHEWTKTRQKETTAWPSVINCLVFTNQLLVSLCLSNEAPHRLISLRCWLYGGKSSALLHQAMILICFQCRLLIADQVLK